MVNLLIHTHTPLIEIGFKQMLSSKTNYHFTIISSIKELYETCYDRVDIVILEGYEHPHFLRILSEYIHSENPQTKILLVSAANKFPIIYYQFLYHLDYAINQQIDIDDLLTLIPTLIKKPTINFNSLPSNIKLSLFENTIIYYVKVQYSNKLIALELDVTERTIERHLQKIYLKFNVTNKSALTKLLNSIEKI